MEPVRAQVAVLSVTGGAATGVAMENVVADALTSAGHALSSFESVKNSEIAIRAQLVGWIEDPDIDLVIIVGDGHNISKALAPLTDEVLPGFADLLRMLAFQEIGASAMLSTAEAARCDSTFVFVLPLGEGAVRAAMEKLILPQLDPNTQPKNLISEMPRFHEEGDFTRVDNDPVDEDEGVPMAIVKEKTATGAGVIPRLPAKTSDPIPDPVRKRPSTQSRVKSATNKNVLVTKIEDPTKPIELQKLEKQIELSKTSGDSTKPMDLSRLPKLPPGASRAQLPPEPEELTVRAPKVSTPKLEAVTRVAPAPERPQSSPVGRPKPKTLPKIEKIPVRSPHTTPAPMPVAKRPAMIVEDASEAQETVERPPVQIPPKVEAAIDDIVPVEAAEIVETIVEPIEPKTTPTPLGHAAAVSSPAHALSTEELEPLSEAEERETFERLPVLEKPKSRPPTQPPPEPKRRPPTQPPPEPVETKRPTAPPLTKPVAQPNFDIPLQNNAELPAGNFDYKVKKSKLPLILALLLIGGIAVGGVLLFKNRGSGETVKDAATVAITPPPADSPEAPVTPDAQEEIEMDPVTADAGKPTNPTRPTNPPRPPRPTPDAAVSSSEPPPDAKVEDKPPDDKDNDCDESSCVIEKYARACCAKYKPAGEGFTPPTGNHDSLEKAQIRAGIDRMRPAISRCGETNPGKGTVKISVTVNPEGAVTGADVVESPSPDLGKCVAGFVRKATFAKTVNGGSFSYPFVF